MENELEKWIIEADIASMQQAMKTSRVTSEQLVHIYLTRIEKYDAILNTILEINPDAINIAKALDDERKVKGQSWVSAWYPYSAEG